MQYLFLLVLGAVPFLIRKQWIVSSMIGLAVLTNCVAIYPLYWSASDKSASIRDGGKVLTILDVNFNSQNERFDALKSLILQSKPDIICWQEFSMLADKWSTESLSRDYPYSMRRPRNDNFGIALFSKIPVENFQVERLAPVPIETIVATLRFNDKVLDVISTHTYPPISSAAYLARNVEMENLGAFVRDSGHASILCGDLNATLWSSSFQKLLKLSGLKDSEIGFGAQPSWPVDLPLMRIPIDQVLVNPSMKVLSRQLGADVYSDHLPVIVKLAI